MFVLSSAHLKKFNGVLYAGFLVLSWYSLQILKVYIVRNHQDGYHFINMSQKPLPSENSSDHIFFGKMFFFNEP